MKKFGKKIKIALSIFAVVAIVVMGICLYKIAYDKGLEAGKNEQTSTDSGKIENLSRAMSEKSDGMKKITEELQIEEELNTDSIKEYLEKLEKFISETSDEGVKSALEEYKGKWQEFQEVYASEDNEKIKEGFVNLKTASKDAAEKIKQAYDENIKNAFEDL